MSVPSPISDVMKEPEARYQWDPATTRVLLDMKGVNVEKISDFMHATTDEKDPSINAIVQAAGFVGLSAMGQVSKLRQAIIALKKAETKFLQRKGVVVDLCDTLVSRLAREMMKRHLTRRDVWDTRTQEFQRKQSAKRTKVITSGDTCLEVVHSQPQEEVV